MIFKIVVIILVGCYKIGNVYIIVCIMILINCIILGKNGCVEVVIYVIVVKKINK